MMLAEFFLISLSFGVGLFTFLANPRATGGGFLKLVASLCASSVLIALAIHLTYDTVLGESTLLLSGALVAFTGIYFLQGDEKTPLMRLFFILHNTCLLAAMFNFHHHDWHSFLFALASSLLLGSVTYAMVMGHWYLVTPKLSEKPLIVASYFSWVFLIVKITWTGVVCYKLSDYFSPGTTLGAGYLFNWLMLTMRAGWGYFVIVVMSYFSYRLIAMRSIQSATGMLYAMTFFVFIGELIANYMFLEYGMKI